MKVWVCEPSVVVRHVVLRLLRESDAEWRIFEEPSQLLAAAGPPPELICIAMDHPGMNGVDLSRQLRLRSDYAATPLVLIAGGERKAATETIERALAAGVTEVFYASNIEALLPFVSGLKAQADQHRLVTGHVLLVEDSISAAQLISKWLRDAGFTVHHEVSAEAALAHFQRAPKQFDIVLADFLLAGEMTGLGLVRGIRQLGNHLVPILVLSSFDDPTRKSEILSTGANDYVTKPVMEPELLARVRILARNKQLIEEIESQRQRLFVLATRDQLTGLHNRRSALEQAAAVLEASRATGVDVGVIMLDLDHFKAINDHHGHTVGDKVLTAVGAEITAVLRDTVGDRGLAARMGGEEFLVLLEGADPGVTRHFGEQLRARIAARRPEGLPVTTSIGFTNLSTLTGALGGARGAALAALAAANTGQLSGQKTRPDVDTLYEAADQHLYAAKAAGRNCVRG